MLDLNVLRELQIEEWQIRSDGPYHWTGAIDSVNVGHPESPENDERKPEAAPGIECGRAARVNSAELEQIGQVSHISRGFRVRRKRAAIPIQPRVIVIGVGIKNAVKDGSEGQGRLH
jgi:hypothetical protein